MDRPKNYSTKIIQQKPIIFSVYKLYALFSISTPECDTLLYYQNIVIIPKYQCQSPNGNNVTINIYLDPIKLITVILAKKSL